MNVPASLRKLADMMESGELPPSIRVGIVSADDEGNLSVYGYGKIGDRASEAGFLMMGSVKIANDGIYGDSEAPDATG